MKKNLKYMSALLICSLFLFNCRAGVTDGPRKTATANAPASPAAVEQPQFPGGKAALSKFIQKNLAYPRSARENNIGGTVEVTFTLDSNGVITNPKVTKGIGGGCDEEALKMLAKMPKWIPAKKSGAPATMECSMPVIFDLM